MRKIFLLAVASLLFTAGSYSQLGGLLKKVKNKTNARVDKKVDETIDKTLDKAEGKTTDKNTENQAGEKKEDVKDSAAQPGDNSRLMSYSRFDFVAGEKIVYLDNFDQETIAELPVGWNTNGSGEVITLEKYPGQWLRLHSPFLYLTRNEQEFTDNYTVEFDIILNLKNNGWMYPEMKVSMLSTNGESTTDNSLLSGFIRYAAMTATIMPGEFKTSKARLNSFFENKPYFTSEAKACPALEQWYGQPVHISIQVQKERFRMWIGEEKMFDVPKGIPIKYVMNQLVFQVGHTNYKDDQYAIYLSNIKVATGKPDTRHKLEEEGRFSTTGILFNVNSAVIKPESYGVLKEVADVMKKNESIRIKIVGHTDSDGSDAANLELSRKRAAAVKSALAEELGIDASRMDTDGKGESEPVGDNKTKEGKGQNRRVEFIKL